MASVVAPVVSGEVESAKSGDRLEAAERLGELERLERVVREGVRGFLAAGLALATIREERLYRAVAGSWSEYVRARFGWSPQMAHGVESGARVAQAIERAGLELPAHASPTMLRPLGPLLRERGEQGVVEAWELVTAATRGDSRPLSGERVRAILAARGEPTVAIRRCKTRVQPIDQSVSRALARARALAEDYAGQVPPADLCRHVSELAARAHELAAELERVADVEAAAAKLAAAEAAAPVPPAEPATVELVRRRVGARAERSAFGRDALAQLVRAVLEAERAGDAEALHGVLLDGAAQLVAWSDYLERRAAAEAERAELEAAAA